MANATPGVGAIIDPFRNYNFSLSIQGVGESRFTECFGLDVRVQPIRYREAGAKQIVRSLPGPIEYGVITLRYGVFTTSDLWSWLQKVIDGQEARVPMTISTLDLTGAAGPSWDLTNAWPCQWSGVAFDTLGREAAIEELRVSCDEVKRKLGEPKSADKK
jgi:phage tail-like protein